MPSAVAAAFPALVAEFTPLSPQAQLAAISILGATLLVLAILAHFRRKPPLDSELMKLSLAIDGLHHGFSELAATVKSQATHATEIEALQEKVRKLEAQREEDQRANRTYTRETTRELFVKIDELKDSFNANFQGVERAMGQLEGKVENLTTQINRTQPPFGR